MFWRARCAYPCQVARKPRPSADRPKPNLRGLGWILGLFTLVQLPLILYLPLTGDEALIWQWAQHLDWGYIDQSPLAAWAVWLSTRILGDTAFAVRLPGLLCALGTIWTFAHLSLDLHQSRRIAIWTAAVIAVLPILQATASLAIVDGEMILFLALAARAFIRAVDSDGVGPWVAAGMWVGLAGLAKLTGLLAGAAGLAALMATPKLRPLLRTGRPYLAAGVALAAFAPVLYWNAIHEWWNLRFTFTTRHGASAGPFNLLYYVGDQTLPLTPFLWWISISGIWATFRSGLCRASPDVAVIAWLAALPLAVFGLSGLMSRGGAHWPSPGLMFGLLMGVPIFLQAGSCLKRTFFQVAWGLAALGSVALHLAVLFLDRIAEARVEVRGNESSSDLKALFGIEAIGPRVLEEQEAMGSIGLRLPGQAGEFFRPFLITPNHVFAAQFTFYAPGHPMAYRFGKPDISGRDYERWQRYAEWRGRDAVFFHDGAIKDGRLEKLKEAFDEVELADPLRIKLNGKVVRTWYLARCYGFRRYPWPEYLEDPIRR